MNRFLFVLPTDRLGGAERVAMNLIRYLSSTQPEIVIYVIFMSRGDSGSWGDLKNTSNIKLIFNDFNSEKVSFPYLIYYLIKTIKKADLVYTTHTHVNALMSGLRKLKLFRCNFLVLRESTIISKRFTGFKKYIFNILYKFYGSQDLLICQTNLMRDELIKARGNKIAHHAKTIPNPLNLSHINTILTKAEAVNTEKSTFIIVMVGRLVPIKNYELVLNALAELKRENTSGFKVKIIGDGMLINHLKSLTKENDLLNEVSFLGKIKDPYHYMRGADLGIVSSISEGFPNVLLEMMASGTKNLAVTPCTGGLTSLPKVTITADHSIKAMKLAILTAMQNTEDFSHEYIEYAKTRDIANFWTEILNNLNNKHSQLG